MKYVTLFLTLLTIIFTANCAFAQLGDGDEPQGSGWWDPASWRITKVADGDWELSSWAYHFQTGLPTNTTGSVSWSNPNANPVAYNSTNLVRTFGAETEGEFTFTLEYIGPGVPPAQILTLITSSVEAGSTDELASVSLDNGIGSPVEVGRGWIASGSKYRMVPINEDGIGITKLQVFGQIAGTAPQTSAEVWCSASIAIAEKAVGVHPWLGTTYYAEPFTDLFGNLIYLPVANDMSDPTDFIIDTFAGQGSLFWETPPIPAALYGNWTNPVHSVTPPHSNFANQGYLSSLISLGTYLNMITGDFLEFELTASASEWLFSRSGSATVRVHAVIDDPVLLTDTIAVKDWIPISSPEIVLPGDSVAFNIASAESDTVTLGYTMGGGLNLSGSIMDVITTNIGISGSHNWGETATITKTIGITHTHNNGNSYAERVWLQQRALYRKVTFWGKLWGINGFEGMGTGTITLYRSGTKANAELFDAEKGLHVEPIY